MYELQFRLLLIFTVANRLDEHLTLLDGTKISVEPYREYQTRNSSQIVSNICQAPPEDDSRSSSQISKGTSNSVDASGNGIHESWSQQSSPPSMHSENRVSVSEIPTKPEIPPTPIPRKAISEFPSTVKTFPFLRAAHLIARDEDTLIAADNLLKQLVLTQNISFDDCQLFFLRSAY